MSEPDANVPDQEGRRLLRIISGLHAGASRELAEREMILVGSGDDCDIVLADEGVARHHALISVIDGHGQLRALDAPLQLEGRVLHPGDPVAMDRLQRVGLGEAALAFGEEDDPAWLALAPDGQEPSASRARRISEPFTRRLPMIAAIAVLCLAALATFVAVVPSSEPEVDPEQRLKAMALEFNVSGRRIETDVNGRPVLSGMVADDTVRQRMQQMIVDEGLDAGLTLTTGADLASDVGEVLRGGGYPGNTRYLGRGEVEVTGYYKDEAAFRVFLGTDAMRNTGVRNVALINRAAPAAEEPSPEEAPAVRIVAYERGEDPHLLDEHGNEYRVGMFIPGEGSLASLGNHAFATAGDGTIRKITIRPLSPEEQEPAAAPGAGGGSAGVSAAASRSHAWAMEQARAAGSRQ
ncbi:FHA domain-containing protein [Luteimonas sp. A478]